MSLNDLHMLNLEQPAWSAVQAKGSLPHRREGHSFSFWPGKNVFVLFGGSDAATEDEYNDVHIFDPETQTWTKGV